MLKGRMTRRRFLATTAAATAIAMPYVRGAHAAGKLTMGFWDHWVPGANNTTTALVNEWAEKEKVEVSIDYITSVGNKNLLTIAAESQAKSGHDIFAFPTWEPQAHAKSLEPVDDVMAELIKQNGPVNPTVDYLAHANGHWLAVPATTNPHEPFTVARMASIPHGTTITAQGTALPPVAGKPTIAAIDITPFIGGNPGNKITFQNQTATNKTTRRLPQDLTALMASGKLTQAMITDPNTVLRDQIAHQTITQTIVIETSTKPGTPLSGGPLPAIPSPGPHPQAPSFAGGAANIAFLQGLPVPTPGGNGSNANAFQMDAVFWIETVVYDIDVPALPPGTPPVILQPRQRSNVPLVPSFVAAIPFVPNKGFKGGHVRVATTQIQYSQKVMLDFAGLTWPHVSVASLVPAAPVPIPDHLLPLT